MKPDDLICRKALCVGYDGIPFNPMFIISEQYLKLVPSIKYFLVLENEYDMILWQESVLEKYFVVISPAKT